jgi:hypothetical protein
VSSIAAIEIITIAMKMSKILQKIGFVTYLPNQDAPKPKLKNQTKEAVIAPSPKSQISSN